MYEFLLILISVAVLCSLALQWYDRLDRKAREKDKVVKADTIRMSEIRRLTEDDLYDSQEKYVSQIGLEANKLVYNESFDDLHKSKNVKDNSFFESLGLSLGSIRLEKNSVTCLMPFHERYNRIYNRIVKGCKNQGFTCIRSDAEEMPGNILKYTVSLILRAELVVAVLDGRNPNVFYEIGIAHCLGKQVILVAEKYDKEEIPFNLKQERFIFYKSLNELQQKLENALVSVKNNK